MLAAYPHPRYDASVPGMTEAQFMGRLLTTAQLYGWRTAHFRPARTATGWRTAVSGDGKGWPDLSLFHRGKGATLFREVKTNTGRVSKEQREWLDTMEACGHDVGVWRPRDWETILKELTP